VLRWAGGSAIWLPRAWSACRRALRETRPEAVLTSGPPHWVHTLGWYLKRRKGLPWVADFRDLWTEKRLLYRPATPLHDWYIRRLEHKVFETADHIIANTPENAERYVRRFGLPQDRITVIPNGFDRDDLEREPASGKAIQVFRIGYAGSLDKHDFPWRIALEALKRLALEVGRDNIKFIHCGYLSQQVKTYLQIERMQDLVEVHGEMPHANAMRLTADTEVRLLLLYENAYSDSIVPLKLYNYLIMNGPILAIAAEQGRTAAIIAETRMGVVVSAKRGVDAVYQQLRNFYHSWQRGELAVDPNLEQIARYDRHTQAMTLAGILRRH